MARNMFFVYFRLLFVTVIGLVTTRLVFQALGQSDYGLYNVVGGIISLLAIVSTAMITTTRRYINYEMGKGDGNLNRMFSVCYIINLVFALLLFVLAETVGMFYIHRYLKVEQGLFGTAVIIFHISTITSILTIINVPYQSLLAAFERFSAIAVIDIVTTLVKLGGVACLFLVPHDRLIIYAVLMSLITLVSLAAYSVYCRRRWKDIIHVRLYKDRKLYKEITVFNNYVVLGASAYIGRSQGTNMLINYFFGTLVNGAFSIAYTVESYAMVIISNLTTAAGPQITKEYSAGNYKKSITIASRINRLSVMLMMSLVFIALIELPFYLKLWLGTIPEGCVELCRWTLISALVRSFSEGLPPLVHASGKIKWFQIVGSATQLSVLAGGWLLFREGYPPKSIIMCFAGVSALNFVITLLLLRIIITKEDILYFLRSSFLPASLVGICLMAFYSFDRFVLVEVNPLANILISMMFTGTAVVSLGLNRHERQSLRRVIGNIINKRKTTVP